MNRKMLLDEAVCRLKILGIPQSTIEDFLDGKVPSSFRLTKKDMAIITTIEKNYNSIIYYVFKTNLAPIGNIWYFLFVSHYTIDWKTDREYTKMLSPSVISYAPDWLPGDHTEIGTIYLARKADHFVLSDRNFQ